MTAGLINRPLIRSVALAAAIVGTVQAVIWVTLSLISILIHHSVIQIDTNLFYSYQTILYEIFLDANNTNDDVIVDPKTFSVFLYIYVSISFIWLVSSLHMLWAMVRDKWFKGSKIIGGWSTLTLLISVFDIIVLALIVADYQSLDVLPGLVTSTPTPTATATAAPTAPDITTEETISTYFTDTTFTDETTFSTDPDTTFQDSSTDTAYSETGNTIPEVHNTPASASYADLMLRQIIYTSYVIMMTLAVRGYILWVINVIFAIILMKFAIAVSKEKTPSLLPMLDGYPSGRPWSNNLYEQTDIDNIDNSYSNEAFTDDNDRAIFRRSDSFINAERSIGNQNPLSNGSNPYAQQMAKLKPVSSNPNVVSPKLAKIGKQNGRRTPPRNVPPPKTPQSNSPYIPDPDYSPPGSPLRPKSVLRPKSNYVL